LPSEKEQPIKTETQILNEWRLAEWFPQADPKIIDQLKGYRDELLKFNKAINLISIKSGESPDLIHFADSIIAAKTIMEKTGPAEFYDFGSGNGFPGLVLAICHPQMRVKLLDLDQRKCEFLKHVISKLQVKNASVLNQSVESLPGGSVDFAVSRGFAGLTKSLLVCRKCFKIGGFYYVMKGEEWGSEVADLPTQLCRVWQPEHVSDYRLPVGEIRHSIIRCKKLSD
jgi:16S rRNA (guanine527-N7)-methyltransferase